MQRLQTLLEWLDKSPHDPFLHFGIAMEYLSASETQLALEKMEFIKNNFPHYLPNYYQLAKHYELLNFNEKAIETYERGIALALSQNENKTAGELNSALEELTF